MNLTFAAQLNKMITAGLGGAVEAPETGVAVGRRVEYTSIGPAPILTFEANSELPLKALSVNMEPIQDLHGQANPYPAGGGKNLLKTTATSTVIRGITFTVNSDGSILANGTAEANANFLISRVNNLNLTVGTQYIISGCPSGGSGTGYRLAISDSITTTYNDFGNGATFTLPEEFVTNNAGISIYIPNGVTVTNLLFKPMIRLASVSDSTFAPYSNICPISGRSTVNVWRESTYDTSAEPALTIQLGQTVYGGTVDVVSGEMVVDRAMVTYDGSENWYANAISGGVKYRLALDSLPSGIKTVTNKTEIPDIVTNILPAISAEESWVGIDGVAMQTTYGWRIYCEAFNTSDAALWKAFLAEHPLTIAYKLAQPITITLTPEQLTTVLGQNNVWSDADEVSLTYGNIYYTEGY